MRKNARNVSVIAVDPGYKQSAWAWLAPQVGQPPVIVECGLQPNGEVLRYLNAASFEGHVMVLEKVAMGGMVAGPETFETCVWSGRFIQAWQPAPYVRIPRISVKKHLTGRANTKDAHVRQALIERFGGSKEAAVGSKAKQGPLYGIRADIWAAVAVGITALEGDEEFNEDGRIEA